MEQVKKREIHPENNSKPGRQRGEKKIYFTPKGRKKARRAKGYENCKILGFRSDARARKHAEGEGKNTRRRREVRGGKEKKKKKGRFLGKKN